MAPANPPCKLEATGAAQLLDQSLVHAVKIHLRCDGPDALVSAPEVAAAQMTMGSSMEIANNGDVTVTPESCSMVLEPSGAAANDDCECDVCRQPFAMRTNGTFANLNLACPSSPALNSMCGESLDN